jgi:uncharacterized membrane protein/S-adenosylmethionine/arginine decarboxylase-like enzyme
VTIRSSPERLLQTLFYEVGGLALITPLYGYVVGHSAGESLSLLVIVAVVTMIWQAAHNTLFDIADFKLTGRLASNRPHWLRILHAISNEVSSIVVTLPSIMFVGGFGFGEALAIDIGLTLFYSAYAYVFHYIFDWLRPMQSPIQPQRQKLSVTTLFETSQNRANLKAHIDGRSAHASLLTDHSLLFKTLHELCALFGRTHWPETQFLRISANDPLNSNGLTGLITHVEGNVFLHTFPATGLVVVELHSERCEMVASAAAKLVQSAFRLADVQVHLPVQAHTQNYPNLIAAQ